MGNSKDFLLYLVLQIYACRFLDTEKCVSSSKAHALYNLYAMVAYHDVYNIPTFYCKRIFSHRRYEL